MLADKESRPAQIFQHLEAGLVDLEGAKMCNARSFHRQCHGFIELEARCWSSADL